MISTSQPRRMQDCRVRSRICEVLADRCADPNIAWPYHPRVGLGNLIVNSLLKVIEEDSPSFLKSVLAGEVSVEFGKKTGGRRRQKKIDMVLRDQCNDKPIVAVEAKACMTAHSKAHGRLVAEITSSLDAVLDSDPCAKYFLVVVVNYGARFTSPLNLPGPNQHGAKDATELVSALNKSLLGIRDELQSFLFVPIDFDNETTCASVPDPHGDYMRQEDEFVTKLLSSLPMRNS